MSFLVTLLLALAFCGAVLGGAVYLGFLSLGGGAASTATSGPHASFSFVPATPTVPPTPSAPAASPTPTPPPVAGGTYVVQAGDSMSIIAVKLGVSLVALEQANPQVLPPDFIIHQDDVLNVPATPTSNPDQYVVQTGDNITSIASKYGIDATTLADFNPQVSDWNQIVPGEVLNIPKPGDTIPPEPSPSSTHR